MQEYHSPVIDLTSPFEDKQFQEDPPLSLPSTSNYYGKLKIIIHLIIGKKSAPTSNLANPYRVTKGVERCVD